MTRIEVALGERGYPVLIDAGLLDRAGEVLVPFARARRLVVVTDRNVLAAQGERLRAGLARAGIAPAFMAIEPGEASKSWAGLASVCDRLLALGVERGDHIVAIGGGVVGDLAGFAAAILKRGVGVVQVPTSLLAMVDSALGGKTGINTAAGKNMVGAFHQPSLVLVDPACLDTLPERELRAGYAEVVKYGLIADAGFFGWCEAHGATLLAGDPGARAHAIATCLAAKAAIVAADERDTGGRRALLNLGHTFAHALEAAAGFSDRLLHGEAVAVGLALAFRFSAERGLCAAADAERVTACLAAAGLPIGLAVLDPGASGAWLVDRMRGDKKARSGALRLILTHGVGAAFVADDVNAARLAAFLDRERRHLDA